MGEQDRLRRLQVGRARQDRARFGRGLVDQRALKGDDPFVERRTRAP